MKRQGHLNPGLPGAAAASVAIDQSTFWSDVVELSKPGIVKMVLVSTAVGFFLAAVGQTWNLGTLMMLALSCAVGTALSGAGANMLNQVFEIRRDGLMPRTAGRPLPAGRITASAGLLLGVTVSMLGVAILYVGAGTAAAMVSLITILSYVFIYTPLKPVTPLATLIGAVPGALPPLIGWAAASREPFGGLQDPAGWSIFLIMFVWQVPHFLAIAWKYRAQYGAAGHRVLPVVDPSGVRTGWTVLVWSLTLIPTSLAAVEFLHGRVGWLYAIVALFCGIGFLLSGINMAIERSDRSARRLFFASIIYLPVVLMAMVLDATLGILF
ncbi:MAG: heme o synthase [Phycisphaerales bacterium]|nr:heme o synthase [Phycisphaerales bacterium]